jgi:DNA-binding MurR/RpiR family transcriptional regulator
MSIIDDGVVTSDMDVDEYTLQTLDSLEDYSNDFTVTVYDACGGRALYNVTTTFIYCGDISNFSSELRTLDEIDRDTFNKAIDKIVSSKNVYIMGVRSCSFLAGFLNYNLRMMFDNIKFVQTTSGSEMFEQLMGMGADDTVIAISFPRYSKSVINAVDYASHSGANIIAITDSTMSPIASEADQLLIAKSDMASFVDSLVAPLSIINSIIVELSRRKRDELTERLKRLEEIWDEYDVYDKNQG